MKNRLVKIVSKGWLAGFVFLAIGVFPCFAVELPPATSEEELGRLLSFPEEQVFVNGNTYLIEHGVIYRLIDGKRYRPRCRDEQMEQLLPRIGLTQTFNKDSIEVAGRFRPSLDRLGHAMKWGLLRKYNFTILAYTHQSAPEKDGFRLAEQRAEWIKNYLQNRWGVPAWRISIRKSETDKMTGAIDTHKRSDANSDGILEIISVGANEYGIIEACNNNENAI